MCTRLQDLHDKAYPGLRIARYYRYELRRLENKGKELQRSEPGRLLLV